MQTEDADYIPYSACSHLFSDHNVAPQPSYELGPGDFGPILDGFANIQGLSSAMTHQSSLEAPFQILDAGSNIDTTSPYSETVSSMLSTLQTPRLDDFQETEHTLRALGAESLDSKSEEFCQFWVNSFPGRWPEEPDFAAFQRLTGVSSGKIKNWFVQKLLQAHTTTATSPGNPSLQSSKETNSKLLTPNGSPNLDSLSDYETGTGLTEFIPDVRHCIATNSKKRLARDAGRPFQCTHKCGQKFPRKGEWVKHEQKNHPQRIWLCIIGSEHQANNTRTCAYCGTKNPTSAHLATRHWGDVESPSIAGPPACRKQFSRKDHYLIHLKSVHGVMDTARYEPISRVDLPDSLVGWYRWCGFCGSEGCFARWKDRLDHLGRHFRLGMDMRQWQDVESRDSSLS